MTFTSKITGTGSALPKRILNNHEIETMVETTDEWITERTGIQTRRIATSTEDSSSSLAIIAAKNALENASLSSLDLDCILFATFTPNSIMPNCACLVQTAIGAKNAVCFDLNAACSGFLYALQTAHAYICSGMANHVLVIGSENTSNVLDWTDRNTCILFGDGAGAVILSVSEDKEHGILDFLSGSDGEKNSVLTLSSPFTHSPFFHMEKEIVPSRPYLKMNGQEVFKFAVRKIPESILQLTEKHHLTPDKIDWYFLHQANCRILSSVAKRLHLPMEKFPMNLSHYGNTSAASVAILLDEWNKKGNLCSGQLLFLSGFGGGLTWGNCLMRW